MVKSLILSIILSAILTLGYKAFANVNPSQDLGSTSSLSVWGNGRASWDQAVIQTVRSEMASFNQARDVETFCPGYSGAGRAQQESCWVRLVSALVYKENDKFNPREVFNEPSGPPSVGLMMLSRNECPNAPSDENLKNPIENLKCGIKKMAQLIRKGQCISCKAGAGAYWSTLRAPYTYSFRNRQGKLITYNLGKQREIAALTANYANFNGHTSLPVLATAEVPVEPQEAPVQAASVEPQTERPSLDGLWMLDFSAVVNQ